MSGENDECCVRARARRRRARRRYRRFLFNVVFNVVKVVMKLLWMFRILLVCIFFISVLMVFLKFIKLFDCGLSRALKIFVRASASAFRIAFVMMFIRFVVLGNG